MLLAVESNLIFQNNSFMKTVLYLVRRIAQSKVVRLESNELVTPTVSGGKVKKPNVA